MSMSISNISNRSKAVIGLGAAGIVGLLLSSIIYRARAINCPIVGSNGETIEVTSLDYTSTPYILKVNYKGSKFKPNTTYFIRSGAGIRNPINGEPVWSGESIVPDSNGNISGTLPLTYVATITHTLEATLDVSGFPLVASTCFLPQQTPGTTLEITELVWNSSTGLLSPFNFEVTGFTKSAGRDAVYSIDELTNGAMHINPDGSGAQSTHYFHVMPAYAEYTQYLVVHGIAGELVSVPFIV
jgi:hypothetical protein